MKNIAPPPIKKIGVLLSVVFRSLNLRKGMPAKFLFFLLAGFFILNSCQNHETKDTLKEEVNLDLRTGDDCTPAENVNCSYDTITQYSSVYQNCYYFFSVIVKTCPGLNGPTVSLYDFQYYPDTSDIDCQNFKNYLDSLYYANNFVQLNYELNELNRVLSHGAETVVGYMMKSRSMIPYCSTSNAAIFAFYESKCLTRCPEEDENGLYFNEISCGNACCIRSRDVCLNDSGVLVFSDPDYITSGECDDLPAQCERPISTCVTPCERL